MQTFATFDDGTTARIGYFKDLGHALYSIDTDTIHVMPAYFGQPDRHAVTISLGRPGDTSGYRLTGLHVGDYFLTGTLMLTGPDFTPHPHPHSPRKFPLADITDPDARADAASRLSQIATHFHTTFA
ncbi:hypothetical protein ACGF7W_35290 [Streptomyces sp. NPDC048219]|uniref:hypothetical protein n=1 Tax=Streptomyces sp. NPDC048219 TaxID=3365517 RepID=UPI00371C665B